MSRLEEILSEHIEGGAGSWKKLYDDIERYARECCIATQKESAEQAMLQLDPPLGTIPGAPIIHESITNPDNIVLL